MIHSIFNRRLVFLLLLFGLFAAIGRPADEDLLLAPKALKPGAAPSEHELLRNFQDPPAEYRSMPLWVWNDELSWPRLQEQLHLFHQQGMGGVFVHPRPGLMTEYLGADWFRLWKLALEEGKRMGMLVNIYDENSYPSGFAGGHVPSRAPDTAAEYIQAELDAAPESILQRRGITVSFFAVEKGGDGKIKSARRLTGVSQLRPGESLAAFRLRRASGNPWTAEFPYVDLTNPQTTREFLDTIYEEYKKHIGSEFGKTVRWSFSDEPLIATAGAYDSATLALPLNYNTLAEFRKRCGYDLADHLPSLYWDVGDYRKVRFDYWQTLHDLWKENFMRPMFLWCDRNNLQFTGHWMEHTWPYPWISPDDASLYAYEHMPGIDMLEGARIRTEGKDPHMLFTIKQVASVAQQLGRRAFCEAYGVSGWDSTFEHYKRFGDWLMAHGINFIDQHLAFATVRGARKRDHPQSFSDVSPWWPYYRLHAGHLARTSYMSSISEARNRLLVLEPTTSGFLWARRDGATPELDEMRADNAELNQFLADHQVDFDLGDEYMIEWFGKQDGRKLRIGRASYELVVWPRNMINLRSQTVPHLEEYLAAGAEILALAPPAEFVDGRPSEQVKALRTRYAGQWHEIDGQANLLREIHARLKPRIVFDKELPEVGFLERFLPDGDRVLFLANTGLKLVKATAKVEGGALEYWDTVTGKVTPAVFASDSSGRLSFEVVLPPAGSQMFVVKKTGAASRAKPAPVFARLEPGDWKISADSPNVLVIDYCDLALQGIDKRDINTWDANWTVWQSHGFERPAWDNAVQFKTRIFDRNHFPPGSGFEAAFHFVVADAAALNGLQLAIETPELYRVTLNGHALDFKGAGSWMDPHILSRNIEKWARTGENVVTVAAHPFDVRLELENIYLRGNFSVQSGEKGFRIGAPAKFDFGSWAKQGYPFYASSVLYESQVDVPSGMNRLRIELPEWQGSVAEVLVDGKRVAVLGWQPYRIDSPVTAGRHTVGVRIVSTPRNVFGPFHNPTKPRMKAWPAAWAEFPEHQPAGSRYDVLDYGLAGPVTISTASAEEGP